MKKMQIRSLMVGVLMMTLNSAALASEHWDEVEISSVPLADGLYMLQGSGGNIGLSVGEDGSFIIDDQYAPLADKIRGAIESLSGDQPRFVVNTHWHGDHTGGNEALGKSGSTIIAHDNVRKALQGEKSIALFNMHKPPSPKAALPVITFDEEMRLYLNGDVVALVHVPKAHTDGDTIVVFENANVIHMGDTFFNGMYPFIDVDSGGSIAGLISAADHVLTMADEETKIIPGHGPIAGKAELQAYREMLVQVESKISTLLKAGKNAEEIAAQWPTADFDEDWGGGFLGADVWVNIVISSIKQSAD